MLLAKFAEKLDACEKLVIYSSPSACSHVYNL